MGGRLDFLTGKFIEDKPKRRKKLPEAIVGDAVDAYLKAINVFFRTIKSDGVKMGDRWRPSKQGKGISDRIGILPSGRFIAVELKAEGKRNTVTPEQVDFLRRIIMHNGIGVVADSVDCVKRALSQTKEEMLADLEALVKRAMDQQPSDPSDCLF